MLHVTSIYTWKDVKGQYLLYFEKKSSLESNNAPLWNNAIIHDLKLGLTFHG